MSEAEKIAALERRMESIQARMAALEQSAAVDRVHRENVERRLSNIEAAVNKLLWLVVGGICVAGVNFLVQGGLAG